MIADLRHSIGWIIASFRSRQLAGSGSFNTTESMNTARIDHTATLLTNGEVLVAGGTNNSTGYLSSAELYNPSTEKWTLTGSTTAPRGSRDLSRSAAPGPIWETSLLPCLNASF